RSAAGARNHGVTRFCMGAAWRQVNDGPEFDAILEMVRGVSSLGLEVCCTLGMLNESQAQRLAEAGLHAYNHNLDTSPEFYGQIITTRTYEDRLRTIEHARKAGITVCCGGDRKSTRLNSSHVSISYAVFCLKKKTKNR